MKHKKTHQRYKVCQYDNVDKNEWDAFIKNNRMGYVYHLYDYIIVSEYEEKNLSFVIRDIITSEIIMIIPLYLDINNTLYARYGFIVKNDLPKHYHIKLCNFFQSYVKQLIDLVHANNFFIEFPSLTEMNYPGQKNSMINPSLYFGFAPLIRYTWIVNLSKPIELIIADCEETTRQAINKFSKTDQYIFCELSKEETNNFAKNFIALSHATYQRSKSLAKSQVYYNHIINELDEQYRKVYYIIDKKDNSILTSAIIMIYKQTAHYSLGASVNEKPPGISKYMFYLIMLELKLMGITYFETGGAYPYLSRGNKLRGISDFKKCFGTFLHYIHMGKFII